MLVSPIRVHGILEGLLEANEDDGPHTALLIAPSGQLMSHAVLPMADEEDEDDGGEGEGEDDGAGDSGASDTDNDDGDKGSGGSESVNYHDDEPYLEGPERLRLLLGLASQWEDDESPRVECELGRLFLRPIPLPEPESGSSNIPAVRPQTITNFVLVLNGTSHTPWSQLAQKADAFVAQWK